MESGESGGIGVEYYELFQSKKVETPVEIMGLDSEKYCYAMTQNDFESLEKLKVAYFSGREFEEVCDILINPTFLISDSLKKVLEMYEREIRFKGVQIFPTAKESKQYPLYWVPQFPQIDVLHKETVIHDNGMAAKLVLDSRKIGNRQIFRISDLLEYKIVISMPVAESILRRRLYGIGLQKLEVV